MPKRNVIWMLAALCGLCSLTATVGCGGNESSNATIDVVPAVSSLSPGSNTTFTANVAGSSSAVNWTATGGTITSGGVFTAGSTLGPASVTATLSTDSTVTITKNFIIAPKNVAVTHPGPDTLASPNTLQFAATTVSLIPPTVTWSVVGGGTVSATGLYTPPALAPGAPDQTVTVTATSTADPTVSGSSTITVTD